MCRTRLGACLFLSGYNEHAYTTLPSFAWKCNSDSTMSKFITDIAIGGYLPGDSILHRLDPRTKILGLVVMLIMVFWYRSFAGAVIIAFGTGLVAYLCGAGWKIWVYQMRRFKWMLLIAAGLNLFFSEGGEPLRVAGLELPFAAESVKSSLTYLRAVN